MNNESSNWWDRRVEKLRAQGSAPFAIETINIAEATGSSAYAGEFMRGEVYAPLAADGGCIRLVWTSDNDRNVWTAVRGLQEWMADCLGPNQQYSTSGERILAERLQKQIADRRPNKEVRDNG
jgi:hypothetical protein